MGIKAYDDVSLLSFSALCEKSRRFRAGLLEGGVGAGAGGVACAAARKGLS